MPFFTMLRGFQVPISILDAFLVANGLDETFGDPPMDYKDPVSDFLREKTGHSKTPFFIPYKMGFNNSELGYIAYDRVMTFG